MRAEKVYQHFLSVLDMYAALKMYDRKMLDSMGDLGGRTLNLIERGFAGDIKALDQAEGNIRAAEAAYHVSPAKQRQIIKSIAHREGSQEDRRTEVQRILEDIEGPTGWKRYGRDIIVAGLGIIVGGVGLLLIQRFVFGG